MSDPAFLIFYPKPTQLQLVERKASPSLISSSWSFDGLSFVKISTVFFCRYFPALGLFASNHFFKLKLGHTKKFTRDISGSNCNLERILGIGF